MNKEDVQIKKMTQDKLSELSGNYPHRTIESLAAEIEKIEKGFRKIKCVNGINP